MHRSFSSRISLATLALLASGCAVMQEPQTTPTPPVEPGCTALHEEIDRLTQAQIESDAEVRTSEERIAALQLRLLEKGAVVESLRDHVATQQVEFDQAIAEVVRSKAKLRSLESKAEAASDLAEAEIALKAVRAQYPADQQPLSLAQVEQLVKMGGQEFQRGNYGGSLYLTSQARAKMRVAEVSARIRSSLEPVAGEIRFATPIQLEVMRTSNLRRAPSLEAEVLATLPKGSSITGYSYKGSWVRVESDRATGWVFHALLGEIE